MAEDYWQNETESSGDEELYQDQIPVALNEQERPPVFSRRLKKLLTLLSTMIIILCLLFIIRDNVLVIRHLTVNGNHNVPWQVVALSAGLNETSNYFNLNETKIREGINRNRYLIYLSMEKYFPSTLVLNIKERIPVGYVRYIGIDYIMADDGMILEKGEKLPMTENMTRISGLSIQDIRVGSVPSVKFARQMGACIDLMKELVLQGMMGDVLEISFAEADNIYLITADGFTVHLGDGNYLRAKVGTMRAVLQELRKQQHHGGVIEATVPGEANYRPDGV